MGNPTSTERTAAIYTTSLSLLERLRQPGQPLAWSRFVGLYTPLLFYWANKKGLSPQDAEDLVQEVLTAMIQTLPRFSYDRQRTFRGWLRQILHNKWCDRQRKARLPIAADADLLMVPDSEDSPFWETEHRQFLVRRALELMQSEFKPSTWKACWEFVVEEKPAAQIASELGIREAAVYVAKCRVLRRLRQELSGLVD